MKPHVSGRWAAQRLGTTAGAEAPTDGETVVRHLGAVQAQLPDMALWALGRRCGRTAAELQAEIDTGVVLRTHVLRPTWHLVHRDDLDLLLDLTAPRVRRLMAGVDRQLGVDEAARDRAGEVVGVVLADGPATRPELATALADGGIAGTGQYVGHVLTHLELDGVMASGPTRDGVQTYATRTPGALTGTRDDRLAELARRYGAGHGAFRPLDLAWWASLTLTEARRAVQLAELPTLELDSEPYVVPHAPIDAPVPHAVLLPNFDEYTSYARDPDDFADFAGTVQDIVRGTGLLLVDGRVAGTWRRTLRARSVRIEVTCTPQVTRRLRTALEAEAEAFGRFVDRTAEVQIDG